MTHSETRVGSGTGYYVRCEPTGVVTSGPFGFGEAYARAGENARAFGAPYEVVEPEADARGVRLYVATSVARREPHDVG